MTLFAPSCSPNALAANTFCCGLLSITTSDETIFVRSKEPGGNSKIADKLKPSLMAVFFPEFLFAKKNEGTAKWIIFPDFLIGAICNNSSISIPPFIPSGRRSKTKSNDCSLKSSFSTIEYRKFPSVILLTSLIPSSWSSAEFTILEST